MNDDALEVLLSTSHDLGVNISDQMIQDCYLIEKEHQYERDRDVPLGEIRRMVTLGVEEERRHTSNGYKA